MPLAAQMQKLWDDNATAYNRFCARHALYRESSRLLVESIDLKPGMTVVDLGCGTGATTAAIAEKLGHTGSIFAVDISHKMLEFARSGIESPNVHFIHAPAEELEDNIKKPVDRVISNFAFFQFAEKEKVLAAVGRILKPGGLFAFNSAAAGFDSLAGAGSDLVLQLILEAKEEAGLSSETAIDPVFERKELHLDDYGLCLIDLIKRELMLSAREVLEFYRIPCVGSLLLGLPPNDLERLLSSVEDRLKGRENEIVLCRHVVAMINRPA